LKAAICLLQRRNWMICSKCGPQFWKNCTKRVRWLGQENLKWNIVAEANPPVDMPYYWPLTGHGRVYPSDIGEKGNHGYIFANFRYLIDVVKQREMYGLTIAKLWVLKHLLSKNFGRTGRTDNSITVEIMEGDFCPWRIAK
jgi:hypothetical protein